MVEKHEITLEHYRKVCELRPDLPVTPWIALGSGYSYDDEGKRTWNDELDYPEILSECLGRHVNNFWDRVEVAAFYPAPYKSAHWEKHFIAYCRGAALKG